MKTKKTETKKEEIQSNRLILSSTHRINALAYGLIEVGADNWLKVKRDDNSAVIGLSRYARVQKDGFADMGSAGRRERFTILDYPYNGVKANAVALPDDASRFAQIQYNRGAVVTFDYRTNKIVCDPGNITVTGGFPPNSRLQNGEYYLRFADHPHEGGSSYLTLTSFAKTWFFIEDTDALNRYLHVGMASEGCLTVGLNGDDVDRAKWTEIAQLLLKQRVTGNEQFVGKLVVRNYS